MTDHKTNPPKVLGVFVTCACRDCIDLKNLVARHPALDLVQVLDMLPVHNRAVN